MTPAWFRASHPGINSRFLAWCYATGRFPDHSVKDVHDGHEYMVWINQRMREAGPDDGVRPSGGVADHDAFTEYLWRVAEA